MHITFVYTNIIELFTEIIILIVFIKKTINTIYIYWILLQIEVIYTYSATDCNIYCINNALHKL